VRVGHPAHRAGYYRQGRIAGSHRASPAAGAEVLVHFNKSRDGRRRHRRFNHQGRWKKPGSAGGGILTDIFASSRGSSNPSSGGWNGLGHSREQCRRYVRTIAGWRRPADETIDYILSRQSRPARCTLRRCRDFRYCAAEKKKIQPSSNLSSVAHAQRRRRGARLGCTPGGEKGRCIRLTRRPSPKKLAPQIRCERDRRRGLF